MRQHYLKRGVVDDFARKQNKQESTTGFHLERWLKRALKYFGVQTFDPCCDASTDVQPLRFNPAGTGTVEAFNGTAWVEVDSGTVQLTANRALISNGTGDVTPSAVTNTELGYLSGVTSSVQTQLNNSLHIVTVPATATSTGSVGQVAFTTTDFYICVAPNTWRHSALNTF